LVTPIRRVYLKNKIIIMIIVIIIIIIIIIDVAKFVIW